MPFTIEEDEGTRFILLCVVSSPVIDNGNDPGGHGKGCDRAWFFDDAGVDIKNFVSALAIASWAKEDPREGAKLHIICNRGTVVGFNVSANGGDAVFGKYKFVTKDNFSGRVLF